MTRQRSLGEFGAVGGDREELDDLSSAERAVWVACRINGVGVREHARATGRTPGTIGNLLSRAERKLEGRST